MNALTRRSGALALVLITLFSAAACSDDVDEPAASGGKAGSSSQADKGGSSSKGGSSQGGTDSAGGSITDPQAGETSAPGGAGPTGPEPIYALTTQVFGESDSQSYVLLTNTLDAKTELSVDDAVVELPGRALSAGPDGAGALFLVSDQAPTVTRYDLAEDGSLTKGKSVSFLAAGVSKFGEYSSQFQFVAEDKAYWFDGPTAQIVVWDPSAMKVTDTRPLTDLAAENQVLSFTTAPVRQGSTLYMLAAWRQGLVITPRVAVIAVDTETDEVTIAEDSRCGYVRDGALAQDGYFYIATEAFGSAANWLDPTNPTPCLLRFDTATGEFDPGFQLELATLVGGSAGGSLITGPNDSVFLRVLDGLSAPSGVTNPRVLASAPAWGWASITLGDEPVSKPVEAPLSSGSVLRFALGDRVFAPLFVEATNTTFVELTAEGPAKDAIALPGLTFSAVKLR